MICPGTGSSRVISSRAGVGTAATIIQRGALRFNRLMIARPTLIVVRHGKKRLSTGHHEWVVGPGQAIAVSVGQYDVTNESSSKGTYEVSWLAWDMALLSSFSFASPEMVHPALSLGALTTDFFEAFARARSAIQDDKSIQLQIAQHRLREILIWLDGFGVNFSNTRLLSFSDRVRTLLHEEPAESWTSEAVARRLHMSDATLRRHLAAESTTFGSLLADVRMSHALNLLQSTDYPVGLIARDVGYESPSRFAIRFRARFGFAPTAIRGHKRARPHRQSGLKLTK